MKCVLLFFISLIVISECQLWYQNGADAQGTNSLPTSFRETLSCQPTYDWIRQDMNNSYSSKGQAVIGNSFTLFYVRHAQYLQCLYVENNQIIWEIGPSAFSPPILSSDGTTLYTYVNNSLLQSYNSSNGQLLESIQVNVSVGIPMLYFSNSTLYLQIFSVSSTSILQFTTVPALKPTWVKNDVFTSMAVGYDLNVYAPVYHNNNVSTLYAMSPIDGSTIWESPIINDGLKTVSVRPDGVVVSVGNCDSYFFDQYGNITNRINKIVSAIFSDSTMLAYSCQNLTVYRLAASGEVMWATVMDAESVTGTSVDGDVIVYVSIKGPAVAGLNASNGEVLWKIPVLDSSSSVPEIPVIVGDSSIVVRVGPNLHRLTSCSDRGLCDGDICACGPDYFSSNCSLYCNTEQCKTSSHGNGACTSTGYCECFDNYFPVNNCTVFCNVTECEGDGGVCSEFGCGCEKGYFGFHCENYCSNNGLLYNNTCNCFNHYFGVGCDLYCDASVTCKGKGYCNTNGKCVCNPGYKGDSCIAEKQTGLIVGLSVGLPLLFIGAAGIVIVCLHKKKHGYKPIE